MSDKLQKEIDRGHKAQSILTDTIFMEARSHIDAELYRLFKGAVPTDTEALSQIKSMQYMHDKYLAYLGKVLKDGKFATMELERRKKGIRERIFGP